MTERQSTSLLHDFRLLLYLYIGLSLVVLAARELGGLMNYGDLESFYHFAEITFVTGELPYIGYWMEYPPLFTWLNLGIQQFWVARGAPEHTYYYTLVILNLLANVGNLLLVRRIGSHLYGDQRGVEIAWLYALLGIPLILTAWAIEPIVVYFMLLGLWKLLAGKDVSSALAITVGALLKVMPGLLVPVAWRFRDLKRSTVYTIIVGGLGLLAYLPFMLISPTYTLASLQANLSKSSWQTLWALIDGNFITGSYGPLTDRLDAAKAGELIGNPAVIPGWLTLLAFGVFYAYLFTRPGRKTDRGLVAFLGMTWCVFLLWSKGWSPSWTNYLLPLIVLLFPNREGVLAAILFSLINLVEWPLLITRGFWWGLYITVPLRTLFLSGFLVACYQLYKLPQGGSAYAKAEA